MISRLFAKSQNKLIGLLVFSTLIPVSILGWYSISSSTQALNDLVVNQMNERAINSSEKISTFLETIGGDVLFLSDVPPVQGIIRARDNRGFDKQDKSSYEAWVGRLNIHFLQMMAAKPYYDKLRYLDENGKEMVRVDLSNGKLKTIPPSELQSQANTEYFIETMKLRPREIYFSPVNLKRDGEKIEIPHKPIIRCGIPIYDPNGKKKGILIANISAEYFLDNMLKNSSLNDLSQIFVLNQNGYYLRHPDQRKELGFELNNNENIRQYHPEKITAQILSGGNGLISEEQDILLSYYTIFPNQKNKINPFIIVYEARKEVIFASIGSFKLVAILITVLSLGTVLVIGIVIIKKLVFSISGLTGIVSSFSVQILSTIEEQERMIAQQSSSVRETTITVDQLNASSQQSAQQAEGAAAGAKQALNRAEEGSKAVEQTLLEMATLKANVEEIAQKIINLNQQTYQIGHISALVTDLANQTNMLALNASVEAVRAGEQGKGFAVVAAEIRRMADESKQSAANINRIVSDIQTAINATVKVANEGTKKVNMGVEIAQKTAEAFNGVSVAIEHVSVNSQKIALNAKQQATATQQIVNAMNSLNQGAAEVATGINQTKLGTQQLSEAALGLRDVI
jgi:methyl-accepting chemotaxis protein